MGDKAVYLIMGCFIGGMAYAVWRNKQFDKTVAKVRQDANIEGYNEAGRAIMDYIDKCATYNLSAGQVAYALRNNGEVR